MADLLAKDLSPIAPFWVIAGCLGPAGPEDVPGAPITMMRTALGVEEGASGGPLDREAGAARDAWPEPPVTHNE